MKYLAILLLNCGIIATVCATYTHEDNSENTKSLYKAVSSIIGSTETNRNEHKETFDVPAFNQAYGNGLGEAADLKTDNSNVPGNYHNGPFVPDSFARSTNTLGDCVGGVCPYTPRGRESTAKPIYEDIDEPNHKVVPDDSPLVNGAGNIDIRAEAPKRGYGSTIGNVGGYGGPAQNYPGSYGSAASGAPPSIGNAYDSNADIDGYGKTPSHVPSSGTPPAFANSYASNTNIGGYGKTPSYGPPSYPGASNAIATGPYPLAPGPYPSTTEQHASAPGSHHFPAGGPPYYSTPGAVPPAAGPYSSMPASYPPAPGTYPSPGSFGGNYSPPQPYPYAHSQPAYFPSGHSTEYHANPAAHPHPHHHHHHGPHQHDAGHVHGEGCGHGSHHGQGQAHSILNHSLKINSEYNEDGHHTGTYQGSSTGFGSGYGGGYNGMFNRPGF